MANNKQIVLHLIIYLQKKVLDFIHTTMSQIHGWGFGLIKKKTAINYILSYGD